MTQIATKKKLVAGTTKLWPLFDQPMDTMDGYIVIDEDPRIRTPHLRGRRMSDSKVFFAFEILLLSVNGTKCFQNIRNK